LATRLIFTNRTDLTAMGGLAVTIERDAQNAISTARTKALGSAFAVKYSTFRFDSTTFDTSVWVYPSLTSAGRVRMTFNQDVYYKFLGDFYVRLSFYDNYDKPASRRCAIQQLWRHNNNRLVVSLGLVWTEPNDRHITSSHSWRIHAKTEAPEATIFEASIDFCCQSKRCSFRNPSR